MKKIFLLILFAGFTLLVISHGSKPSGSNYYDKFLNEGFYVKLQSNLFYYSQHFTRLVAGSVGLRPFSGYINASGIKKSGLSGQPFDVSVYINSFEILLHRETYL
jgi:hypothetical protein